jgi:hypothetical protein
MVPEFISALILGAISGVIGGGMVLLVALLRPPKHCPDCGTPLPKFGWATRRSAWSGGWICPKCRCEIDRKGRKILGKEAGKKLS